MSDASDPLRPRLELAIDVARQAGQVTLDFFQSERFDVQRKADNSPVTQADLQAEQCMRDCITAAFAEDGIVGEELGTRQGTSGYRWILDPIDGTKSFISGVPLYSVLVGIVHQQRSVVGVILIPGLDELVYAAEGRGAWWVRGGGAAAAARVSSCAQLADGLFVTSQVDSFAQRGAGEAFERLARAAYITRTWGDGYGYLLVATGRAAAMVDPVMNLWDAAAIQPILAEAGGAFTDWRGEPTIGAGEGVGSNGRVHDEVLSITRDYPRLS